MKYEVGDLVRYIGSYSTPLAPPWVSLRGYNVGVVLLTQTKYLGYEGIKIRWNSGLTTQHRRDSVVIAKIKQGDKTFDTA